MVEETNDYVLYNGRSDQNVFYFALIGSAIIRKYESNIPQNDTDEYVAV